MRWVAAALMLLAFGCAQLRPLSFGDRARYGMRDLTALVVATGERHVCGQVADGGTERLDVATSKVADLADSDLLGRWVAFYREDGLVVGWDKTGDKVRLRHTPAIDPATCQPFTATEFPGAADPALWLRALAGDVPSILEILAGVAGDFCALAMPPAPPCPPSDAPDLRQGCALLGACVGGQGETAHHLKCADAMAAICGGDG